MENSIWVLAFSPCM